jgi:DNA-binding response OmpR family regulator
MRILIVEDDARLGAPLLRVFGEEGAQVELCTTAKAGLRHSAETFDVILLDWMLPDGDGLGFCDTVRRANVLTPILMLTARAEVPDRVAGLRAGADDYLVKPFEVEELLARVAALVRRSQQLSRLLLGDLVLDRLQRRCSVGGVALDLTAREYELLLRLAAANGAPVPRATLLRDVWRMDFDPGSGVLDVQVSRLREKLGAEAARIETVRGVGYRLRTGT